MPKWKGDLLIVTQNIDDLHEKRAVRKTRAAHARRAPQRSALCTYLRYALALGTGTLIGPAGECPACQARESLRPDVVWFGEMPYQHGPRSMQSLRRGRPVRLVSAPRGAVYPAAGFVQGAREMGARTLELNLEPSQGTAWFEEARHGPATQLVPEWVDEMLKG